MLTILNCHSQGKECVQHYFLELDCAIISFDISFLRLFFYIFVILLAAMVVTVAVAITTRIWI